MVMSVSFFGYGQKRKVDTITLAMYRIDSLGYIITRNIKTGHTIDVHVDSGLYYYHKYLLTKKRGIRDSNNIYFKKLNSIKK